MKRILLLLCITIYSIMTATAQAQHNTNCMRCKYSKNYIGNRKPGDAVKGRALNECGCPACGEKAQKEHTARQAEEKRRVDETIAKDKAAAAARKKAFEEQQQKKQQEAKTAKSGEVLINRQAPATIPAEQIQKPAPSGTRFMRGNAGSPHLYAEEGEIMRPERDGQLPIYQAHGASPIRGTKIARYLHPEETAVIRYTSDPLNVCNGYYQESWDIINYDWEPLFKNVDIHYIEHFYGDWFLIGYQPCEAYEREYSSIFVQALKLYNVATKKFEDINIQYDITKLGLQTGTTQALRHNGDGNAVFHNRVYMTGVYKEEDWIKHGAYELLFDEETGGKDGWKAAVSFDVYTPSSPKTNTRIVYLLDKNDQFKGFTYDSRTYHEYYYKPAE
jgi:hypothetical protein